MKTVRDRVAAITGAGSGIGRATAILLAREGCHLALSDIDEASVQETASSCHGVKVTCSRVDVADRNAVHAWCDASVAAHGRMNIVINNAGVAMGATVESMSYEDLEWLMGINFWGVVYGTKAFLPRLRASGEGHVINLSSVFGLIGVPTQATYNATKFAVRGFTEALRQELDMQKSCVSATCVHPGGIRTNIARAARYDKSAEAITGQSQEASQKNFEKMFRTTAAEAVKVILRGVERDLRRVLIGPDAYFIDAMQRLLPTGYQKIIPGLMRRQKA